MLRVALKNSFSGARFPEGGFIEVVADTGYDGFLAVPERVYRSIGLDRSPSSSRSVLVADGRRVELRSSPATVELQAVRGRYDGPVETGSGIGEVLAGTRLLSRFRAEIDYCFGGFSLSPCP